VHFAPGLKKGYLSTILNRSTETTSQEEQKPYFHQNTSNIQPTYNLAPDRHESTIIISIRRPALCLALFLPPLAVFLKEGFGGDFIINILLCLLWWLPGIIHAWWVLYRYDKSQAEEETYILKQTT
ncbi:hypothetical protein PHISCL_10308, partial [Aspergillus sclerotialis]